MDQDRSALAGLFVASERMVKEERGVVERVTCVLLKAARLFLDDPNAWVVAASKRRPDVSPEKIRKLREFFQGDWPVNGGIQTANFEAVLETLKAEGGPRSRRALTIDQLLATEFERNAIKELGVHPN